MDIICDIDGTLMDINRRRIYAEEQNKDPKKRMDWDIFLDPKMMKDFDRPNWDLVNILKKLKKAGDTNIIFTSARNERHREATLFQIAYCGISMGVSNKYSDKPQGNFLYLRKDGDFRPDDVVKKEIFNKIKEDGFTPQLAFDDRDQVVKMWREMGIPCYQVREGKF